MDTVTVKIDITKPAGRKLVKELQKKKVVTIESTPISQLSGVSDFTTEDLIRESEDFINNHFGSNIKMYEQEI